MKILKKSCYQLLVKFISHQMIAALFWYFCPFFPKMKSSETYQFTTYNIIDQAQIFNDNSSKYLPTNIFQWQSSLLQFK